MAALLNMKKFAKLVDACTSLDMEVIRQDWEDKKNLFYHIMQNVTEMKEIADIPISVLLQIAACADNYMDNEVSWDLVDSQIVSMEQCCPVKRVRVL